MAEPKAGDIMTGKFNNCINVICITFSLTAQIVVISGGLAVAEKTGLYWFLYIFWFLAIVAMISLVFLLRKCDFLVDDERVVFRVAFLKHTYSYAEIHSASTKTGFVGRHPRIGLVISLSDGECITYYDENVPFDVVSTPENHKFFQDKHQFTALCKYINERAKG